MATVTLENICKSFGKTDVIHGVDIDIADGEFIVIVGPSGCGKSTLLRMIAGLETVTSGEVRIGGRRVNDVEPMDRDIAMVFQNYALYPHMNVFDNMAYGLKIAGKPRAEIAERVAGAARLLQLEPYLDRKPRELSGGQRQRVAMGRAIVRKPAVFLFDEPLSNLDAKLRVQMRLEIRQLQRDLGVTAVYVTHDQVEAMTLADKIVVLRAGRVEQVGKPLELYHDPDNRFVAGFIGSPAMNFIAATASRSGVAAKGLGAELPATVALPTGDVVVGLRPQHLHLKDGTTHRVEMTEALGGVAFVHLTAPSGEKLVIEAHDDPHVSAGAMVGVGFDAAQALFFASDAAGRRLR